MTDMVEAQAEPLWGIVPFLHNWLVFTPWGFGGRGAVSGVYLAETNRAPFDLPEAESEYGGGLSDRV